MPATAPAIADTSVGSGLGDERSDGDGRYRIRLPAGAARRHFNGLPDGFAYPNPQVVKHLDIKSGQADIEGLDFVLRRRSDQGR